MNSFNFAQTAPFISLQQINCSRSNALPLGSTINVGPGGGGRLGGEGGGGVCARVR